MMPLELKIVSEHADLVGDDAVREFYESGGTIGRSLHNDWILPDPDRYISGRHATIDFKGGIYYLADISSNGVYVNSDVEPLGKGNPRRLFDGDRLRMGDFEFEVTVDSGESLVMPMEEEPSVAPDNIEQFVDEVSLETGVKLLDEDEITEDDAFQSALFGSGPKEVDIEAEAFHIPDAAPAKKPSDEPQSVQMSAEDLFDSFLDGLGINRVELHPSINRPEMMLTAGQVLRQFVMGATDLLASRANLKNSFRLDQTTVLPRQNNPMKFSENTNDLIKQLLSGSEGDYLGARDSIQEVFRDLLNHQNAFLDAMNSAFIEFSERLDPDELQDGFDRTLGKSLFSFGNNGKYWQLYCDLYPVITEKGGGCFPQMFGEEFVRAYERQVAEYRRFDREGGQPRKTDKLVDQTAEPGLMGTQKFDPSAVAARNTGGEADVIAESAFDEDDVVDVLSDTGAVELDHSFIDELENSLTEEVSQDQIKA